MDNGTNTSFCRHLKSAALKNPSDLAVAVQKSQFGKLYYDEINFKTLNEKSDAVAYALNAYGIKKGMKAVLMVTPSIDFFALTFALFKAGIIPILVDPGMGIKNLKQCFIESKPDAFIGIPKAHIARKLFSWGDKSVKHVLTVGGNKFFTRMTGQMTLARLLEKHTVPKPYPIEMLADDDMAAILFTSGSTGVPKGVVYSHKMFEAQIFALKNDYKIESGERDLATFPLFSLFGPALGMASIVPDMDASKPITANPKYIFAAIEKYQCSNLFANPALIEILGQAGKEQTHKLPSLKRVISAGAPATLSSITTFSHMLNDNVEVLNSYGATESLPLTKIGSKTLLATQNITDSGGGICVGKPVLDVEVAIIKITEENICDWQEVIENDLLMPANKIGEIVVKGPMVSQAYYERISATNAAKIQDKAHVRHRMGDLGYLDQLGQLWMCGRKAHRVETLEQTFFSIPCERIFNTHALVKRTALVAITHKNSTKPLLCIELNKGVKISEFELFSQLTDIGKNFAQTKGISDFLIHPSFPVDIRHNAKIFREKLAIWAQKKFNPGD
ncbi:olefin beta-lactone synthetase [Pseudoalteromonas denitrificans]|uniref:Acyl-CoA synthetase (AMP-forming)/AMP-acid ligase II n=1 Tax=Pseudoalteromonas denitrificans DSM 6059 TaxID=1123010 RepID=A0A1I1PV45_9GAMM|nr:fatty acid CoA ligase family protein [Pseudoalteromonas denitrificans]SFD13567.1 Acyl-CoA synthetase (AMP-forming)/AMP-acid ligase II [Pseudoalteromonas denitrificans DSM 6059]